MTIPRVQVTTDTSAPASARDPREPPVDGPNDPWGAVRSTIASWSWTVRLCLILMIIGIPANAATWMILR